MTERINAFLRSEAALLALLAMALISQTPHTAVLFHRLSPVADGPANLATWLHAVAYAIALEFATLVFVVRGQRGLAWLFALVSIAVNLLYYAVGELTAIYVLSALMVSIALPSSIAFYSHSVAEHAGTQNKQTTAKEWRWMFWRKDTQNNAAETPQDDAQHVDTTDAETPQTDGTSAAQLPYVPAPQTERKPARKTARKRKATKLTPEQRRAQIVESGMDDAATIAAQFRVSMRTAQADIAATRDAIMQTNGVGEHE